MLMHRFARLRAARGLRGYMRLQWARNRCGVGMKFRMIKFRIIQIYFCSAGYFVGNDNKTDYNIGGKRGSIVLG